MNLLTVAHDLARRIDATAPAYARRGYRLTADIDAIGRVDVRMTRLVGPPAAAILYGACESIDLWAWSVYRGDSAETLRLKVRRLAEIIERKVHDDIESDFKEASPPDAAEYQRR